MKLTPRKLGRFWWLVGSDVDYGPIGPYPSRAEAVRSGRHMEESMAMLETAEPDASGLRTRAEERAADWMW